MCIICVYIYIYTYVCMCILCIQIYTLSYILHMYMMFTHSHLDVHSSNHCIFHYFSCCIVGYQKDWVRIFGRMDMEENHRKYDL